jgi:23S rRNA pseudouridine1911/1915/1917 synthase
VKLTAHEAGRVDKALAKVFPDAGRRALSELFDEGAVRLRGKRAKKGDRVEVGDEIELARAPSVREAPAPDASITLDVLVERPELIALCKPAGMPSQPLRAGELGCAANAIAARWPECAKLAVELEGAGASVDVRDGGLVHRLDVGTSGVLIAARTAESYRALREAFASGGVTKEYLALCGARPVSRECDAPLAQRGDHVRVDYTDGLAASTDFAVERATATHSLVRCTARTGRMHQVRAHLAHVGAPIAGDVLYGGAVLDGMEGFFLHAAKVVLPGEVVIEAPLPARFAAALAAVGL